MRYTSEYNVYIKIHESCEQFTIVIGCWSVDRCKHVKPNKNVKSTLACSWSVLRLNSYVRLNLKNLENVRFKSSMESTLTINVHGTLINASICIWTDCVLCSEYFCWSYFEYHCSRNRVTSTRQFMFYIVPLAFWHLVECFHYIIPVFCLKINTWIIACQRNHSAKFVRPKED
jgi:hypothetical protein